MKLEKCHISRELRDVAYSVDNCDAGMYHVNAKTCSMIPGDLCVNEAGGNNLTGRGL
jgi:hypothetical protein